MSEPVPEAGGGGFMSRKILGMPAWVILAAVALLAYMYFRNRAGGSGTASTSGSGTSTTGAITVKPGGTTYNVNVKSPQHATKNPQPTPKPKPTKKTHQKAVTKKSGKEAED